MLLNVISQDWTSKAFPAEDVKQSLQGIFLTNTLHLLKYSFRQNQEGSLYLLHLDKGFASMFFLQSF